MPFYNKNGTQKNTVQERKSSHPDFFLSVFFCALGLVSIFFASVPMILAYLRFPDPWRQWIVILGCIAATFFFMVPLPVVLMLFPIGMYLADAVANKKPILQVGVTTLCFSIFSPLLLLFALCFFQKTTPSELWASFINSTLEQIAKQSPEISSSPEVKKLIKMEIFTILALGTSSFLFSLWTNLGIIAHFRYIPDDHPYSYLQLQKLRFSPLWLIFLYAIFSALLIAIQSFESNWFYNLIGSLQHIFHTLFLIQSTIVLSVFFRRKNLSQRAKTFLYSIILLLSLFTTKLPLMVLGMFGPFALDRKGEKKT